MSFTDISSTPHQSRSPQTILKNARKQYLAKYMNKTDQQLDNDYYQLLRIVDILKFKTNKAMQTKLADATLKKRRKPSQNPITQLSKDSELINRQIRNNSKRIDIGETNLNKVKRRLAKIESPKYKINIQNSIEHGQKEIAQLKKQIKVGRRKLQKNGAQLIIQNQQSQGEVYKKLLEQLESQKQKLLQQTFKNQQLQKQVQLMQKNSLKEQEKLQPLKLEIKQFNKAEKVNQIIKSQKILSSRSFQSPRQRQIKLTQLQQLHVVVNSLDERLRLVESHISQSQLKKMELERLATDSRSIKPNCHFNVQ